MKNIIFLLLMPALLFTPFTSSSGADDAGKEEKVEWGGGGYLGGGFTYFVEHFRGGLGSILHNSRGFSLGGGYLFTPNFALGLRVQYYDEFRHRRDVTQPEWWYLVSDQNDFKESQYLETVTVSGFDITVNALAFLPLGAVKPYAMIGLGYGRSKLKVKEEVDPSYVEPGEPTSYSGSKIWNGCLGRIGVGCALIIYDNFGINGEAAYNVGFGDLDTLRFVSLTMGFFREF